VGRYERTGVRLTLQKSIANDFNKATAFCNTTTRLNCISGFTLHKRSFVQSSDLSNHEALPRGLHHRFGHFLEHLSLLGTVISTKEFLAILTLIRDIPERE
jgi:hypothetical protein